MSVESRELTLWLCGFASCTDRNCNFYVSPATIFSNVHYFPSWVWKLANVASKVPFASSIKLATFSCGYCQGLSRICIHLRQEKRKKRGSERLVRYFPLIRLTIGDSRSARARQKIKEGKGKGGIDRRNETNHRKNEQCHAPLPFIVTRYYVTWCSFYRKNDVYSHNTLRHNG